MTPEFLLTPLVVVASPGTGVVYTVAAGLARGARASVVAALGCTLGTLPHMVAAVTGLAALLQASALAFEVVRYLGVAYLLWMAWNMVRAKGALQIEPDAAPRSSGAVIVSAILVNLLNPKLSIFFVAFLPQFVAPGSAHPTQDMLLLSLAFMAITFAAFVLYGIFAAAMRHQVLDQPSVLRWISRAFGAAFVVLAARLALMHRQA